MAPQQFEDWGFASCNPPYNAGKAHLGADSQGPSSAGAAVVAMAAGRVVKITASGWPGAAIGIAHQGQNGEFVAVYGHVVPSVSVGSQVSAGQQIATLYDWTAADGDATNEHLHLGIWPVPGGGTADQVQLWGADVCVGGVGGTVNTHGYTNPIPYLQGNPPAANSSAPLRLTSGVTVTAPEGWWTFRPIRMTFAGTNQSSSTVNAKYLIVAIRDPYGSGYDLRCATDLAIPPGGTFSCDVTNPWGSVGAYTYWADWMTPGGVWHTGQLGPQTTFTLNGPSAPLRLTSGVSVTAAEGWWTFRPIRITFTGTNQSGSTVDAKYLIVAIRDPYGSNYDLRCATDLSIPPGGTFSCDVSNPWGSVGAYTYWADWMTPDGTWHTTQLGPQSTFTLNGPSAPLRLTSGVSVTASEGWWTFRPIRMTFAGVNQSSSTVNAKFLIVAIRDPYGSGYDLRCATDLAIPPGGTFSCDVSNPWGSVGAYTYWADWMTPDGTWHTTQLGPQSTFTLSPAAESSPPLPPHLSLISVVPGRVLETRSGFTTVDGQMNGVGRVAAGQVIEVPVTGRAGVPVDSSAVMINVTAVSPDGSGFMTVFPCGTARPNASSVNYTAGQVVPNGVLAKIGNGGKVCIYTLATTDVLVDTNGYT